MMLIEKVKSVIEKRMGLHPNDPSVEAYWSELADLLGNDEKETIAVLDKCSEEEIEWISEVFEDISEKLKSSLFIEYLRSLDNKFPNLNLESFIDDAEAHIAKR